MVSDSRAIACEPLEDMMSLIAAEYGNLEEVTRQTIELKNAMLDVDEFRARAQSIGTVDDTRILLGNNRLIEAVFPLRYAALSAMWHYARPSEQQDAVEVLTTAISGRKFRASKLYSAVVDVLLLKKPPMPELYPAYLSAVQTFEQSFGHALLRKAAGNTNSDRSAIRP